MEMLEKIGRTGWALLTEMAPYLLLGFLFAGILRILISARRVAQSLGKPGFRSALKAAAIGIPLPLCSCGVIPTGISFYRNGAGKGATNAFLISTPQTGIDSILLTYTLLGPVWAVARPLIALFTGIFGGFLTDKLVSQDETVPLSPACETVISRPWPLAILHYAFIAFLSDISRQLLLGIVLAIAITVIIPPDFFNDYLDYPLLNMLIILGFSVPLYVCATGSIPIAAALLITGVSPGAVLVFLMAGPATNVTTLTVLWRSIGKKATLVYLFSIVTGALAFGLLIDYLLPAHWFETVSSTAIHAHGADWFSTLSAILLLGLILYAEIRKIIPNPSKTNTMAKTYKVEGMSCNHCKNAVETAVLKVEGVTSAVAYPTENKLEVEGRADDNQIREAVEKLGYIFKSA